MPLLKNGLEKDPGNSNAFVFDVINEHDTAERVRLKNSAIYTCNQWLDEKLGEDLGFDLKLTTYVARHSFATILVRSGAPFRLWQVGTLGHSNTYNYSKIFCRI